MRRVIAVGHADGVTDLITELRREPHHGLTVVGACLTAGSAEAQVAAVPVCGGLERVQSAVSDLAADTVAVLACPELNGTRLRELAWQLEKTGTDLCVAPAVIDVAGPRTTIRPVAGLPLLHVDQPELTGVRRVIKGAFDKVSAAAALVVLAPLLAAIALAIRLGDGGPAIFRQTRVGKDGQPVHGLQVPHDGGRRRAAQGRARWRTTTATACCSRCAATRGSPRSDAWLRQYSLDELPQLWNVLKGDMSLVGPRPAAARGGRAVRRLRAAQARRQAGDHRPVAGQRAVGPALGRGGPARRALRRELVARPRLADPLEDLGGGVQRLWRLLGTVT